MKFSNYTGLSRFEVLQAITKITNEDLKLYKEDIKNLLKENYPKEDLENYNKLSNNEKDLFILELLYKEMNINEDKTIDKIFFEDGREIYNRYEYHGLDIIEKILKQYIEDAAKLYAIKVIAPAMRDLKSKSAPPKNKGTITKRFFIHCFGRIRFKYALLSIYYFL